jgi:hypothetical protein
MIKYYYSIIGYTSSKKVLGAGGFPSLFFSILTKIKAIIGE